MLSMTTIPTVYVPGTTPPRVTPGCEWVVAGEGRATKKYRGVRFRFDGTAWLARRLAWEFLDNAWQLIEIGPALDRDDLWEPAENSKAFFFFASARNLQREWTPGQYDLIGPLIERNLDHAEEYLLAGSGNAEEFLPARGRDPLDAMILAARYGYAGLVWRHPDGREAQMFASDVPQPTRITSEAVRAAAFHDVTGRDDRIIAEKRTGRTWAAELPVVLPCELHNPCRPLDVDEAFAVAEVLGEQIPHLSACKARALLKRWAINHLQKG